MNARRGKQAILLMETVGSSLPVRRPAILVSLLGLIHCTEWSTAEERKWSLYLLQLLTNWGIQESVNLFKMFKATHKDNIA